MGPWRHRLTIACAALFLAASAVGASAAEDHAPDSSRSAPREDRLNSRQPAGASSERKAAVTTQRVEGELFEEARILASLAEKEETFPGWASRHQRRTLLVACVGMALLVLSLIGYVRT